uniref:Uncharacterized protein n=1 Tax=Moniliophthora roreri TaxID=221103 RepID=A0A0W0GA22_MONRR
MQEATAPTQSHLGLLFDLDGGFCSELGSGEVDMEQQCFDEARLQEGFTYPSVKPEWLQHFSGISTA